jgi:hypothetical protein
MVSRKTMFGIGLPKDPTDPSSTGASPGASTGDPTEQSSPTVVDDEKVAEGLKQLRSWYQETSHEDDTRRVVAPAVQPLPPASSGSHARPTAVGHATGEAPPQTQRALAPDPMRATMFGHDLHRLDFEAPLSGLDSQPEAPPSPLAAAPAQKPSPRPHNEAPRQQSESIAEAAAPMPEYVRQAESLPETAAPMPEYLRRLADRPPESGAFRLSSLDHTDRHQAPRVPLMARLVLVTGVAALTVAALLWIQSRSSDGPTALPSDVAPRPSLPAPAPPIGTARTASPVAGDSTEALPMAPAQSMNPTPAPAPTVAPKTARPAPAPAVARPAPRRKPRIPEPEASASDDLASAPPAPEAVASPIGPPPQGKDVSPPEQTVPLEHQAPVRKKADGARQSPSARTRIRDADATMPPSIE